MKIRIVKRHVPIRNKYLYVRQRKVLWLFWWDCSSHQQLESAIREAKAVQRVREADEVVYGQLS